MTEYYVSGCVDNGIDIETVEDDVAEFWTLYERDENGLSQGIVDLRFREDAEAAMRVYQERDQLQEQVKALAAENVARGEIVERMIGQYGAAGYHAVQNSLNPGQSLLYDAMQVMKQPATDAFIAEVKAQGVDEFATSLKGATELWHPVDAAEEFAASLRAAPAEEGV